MVISSYVPREDKIAVMQNFLTDCPLIWTISIQHLGTYVRTYLVPWDRDTLSPKTDTTVPNG